MNRFVQKAMQRASKEKREARKQGEAMVEYMRSQLDKSRENTISPDSSLEALPGIPDKETGPEV